MILSQSTGTDNHCPGGNEGGSESSAVAFLSYLFSTRRAESDPYCGGKDNAVVAGCLFRENDMCHYQVPGHSVPYVCDRVTKEV